jgi:hypothetical protein
MKKLVYNENTKAIDIVECEDITENKNEKEEEKVKTKGKRKGVKKFLKSNTERQRKFLEKNKIYFEVFSYVFVGIMGIMISYVGWKTNIRTAQIYQRQLDILDNDREPYFTIHCKPILERFESEDDYYTKKLYTIKNEGGLINGAFLYGARGYAIIFLIEPETKKEKIYKLYISEMFENSNGLTSFYDEQNKSFCFYGYEGSKYDKFRNELGVKLEELFEEYSVSVYFENYVDIVYVNYKNEECSHTYKFLGESMSLSTDSMEKERVYVGGVEKIDNVENIAKDVYKIIKDKDKKIDN